MFGDLTAQANAFPVTYYSDLHNYVRLLHAGKGHCAAIQMICAVALTAPHANYDGPAHGGMANGVGVFVKVDPFCRNSRCRIEVLAALFCI